MTHLSSIALTAALALWAASELSVFARDLQKSAGRRSDGGSRPLFFVAFFLALLAARLAGERGIGTLPGDPALWQWLGAAMVVTGVALRQRAVRRLGAYFRTHVTILDDHRLITDGPYARVRHPSYTGGLVSIVGLGLGLGNAVAVLALAAAATLSFGYRIRIEERALADRFGAEWCAYRARTGALFPRAG